MRKFIPPVLLILAALAVVLSVQIASAERPQPIGIKPDKRAKPTCVITVQEFRPVSAAVWDITLWKRGRPKEPGMAAYQRALRCAPSSSHRRAIKRTWERHRSRYMDHRREQLWVSKYEPYYGCTSGGCDTWAIPAWSVQCESQGGVASANLYGNTQTYRPGMSKKEQSEAAYNLMAQYGGGYRAYEMVFLAWEHGCTGWPGH